MVERTQMRKQRTQTKAQPNTSQAENCIQAQSTKAYRPCLQRTMALQAARPAPSTGCFSQTAQ
jgi:hypothetical protein